MIGFMMIIWCVAGVDIVILYAKFDTLNSFKFLRALMKFRKTLANLFIALGTFEIKLNGTFTVTQCLLSWQQYSENKNYLIFNLYFGAVCCVVSGVQQDLLDENQDCFLSVRAIMNPTNSQIIVVWLDTFSPHFHANIN